MTRWAVEAYCQMPVTSNNRNATFRVTFDQFWISRSLPVVEIPEESADYILKPKEPRAATVNDDT